MVTSGIKFAISAGIKKFIVSLTLIGFSTFAPQLFITLQTTVYNYHTVSIGIIVGFNISCLGLMLGISAIIRPIKIERSFIKFELIILLLMAILFHVLSLNDVFGYYDSIVLLIFCVCFIILDFLKSQNDDTFKADIIDKSVKFRSLNIFLSIIGLIIIIGGSIGLAFASIKLINKIQIFNGNKFLFSVLVITNGIMLPDLIKCIYRSINENKEIHILRIVRSNIFTLTFVTGVVALVKPIYIPKHVIYFDNYVLILLIIALTFFVIPNLTLTRKNGIFLLGTYVIYIVVLILKIF